ncbi:MAG: hypothetical protein IKD53_03260, partial [Clostridia bacterium]|nr:hypothetical protein [Clostridia bacterium]
MAKIRFPVSKSFYRFACRGDAIRTRMGFAPGAGISAGAVLGANTGTGGTVRAAEAGASGA